MAYLTEDSKKNVKLLQAVEIFRAGDTLKVKFDLENSGHDYYVSHESDVLNIAGKISFQLRVMSVCTNSDESIRFFNTFYVKALNLSSENKYQSYLLTCYALENEDRRLDVANDNTWRLISLWRTRTTELDFTVEVTVVPNEPQPVNNILAALYEDEDLTDFELCGEDGTVRVHKAMLAAASPVLHAMLRGQWLETGQGTANVAATRATLLHLRAYIYLNQLPKQGRDSQNLLLLANYYQMSELRQRCIRQLARSITPENLLSLTEFAVKNSLTDLHLMILESVQKGAIELEKVRQTMKDVL